MIHGLPNLRSKMNLIKLSLVGAATAVMFAGGQASAGGKAVVYNSYTFAYGESINILTPRATTVEAGIIDLWNNGQLVAQAYSIDAFTGLRPAGALTKLAPLSAVNAIGLPDVPPIDGTAALTDAQWLAIAALSWGSILALDVAPQLYFFEWSPDEVAAAFQIAIWEEEYGSAFTFSGVPDATANLATYFLKGARGVSASQPYFISMGFFYDASAPNETLITPIPEPSPWAMMVLCFAGLGSVRYRREMAAQLRFIARLR
jgi:hypothetical protein